MSARFCAGCGKGFSELHSIHGRGKLQYHSACKPDDPAPDPEGARVAKVVSIARNQKKYMVTAICLICQKRWIEAVTHNTAIFKLPCPSCKSRESYASFVPYEFLREQ